MPIMRITKQAVDQLLPSSRDVYFWDATLKGFGLRISPSGVRSYVVQYRTFGGRNGRTQRITIGKHGSPWTADDARRHAKRLLTEAASGDDPAARDRAENAMPSVSELCDRYLRDGLGTKKPSTVATDRGRIERHIKPLLGPKRVSEVNQNDINKFLRDVATGKTAKDVKTKPRGRAIVEGGKGTATRTVGLLGGIFSFAVKAGLIDSNPVHGVERFADKKNVRFLTKGDIETLGGALLRAEASGTNQKALAVIRLLLLTGARRGEIETLLWSAVDFSTRTLRLDDSKTGQKILPLNSAAEAVLVSVSVTRAKGQRYVFPSGDGTTFFSGTPKIWNAIRKDAGFPELRLHDLRHSFASLGVLRNTPLAIVGLLLGHADIATTQRYAHLSDDPVRAASEALGSEIAAALGSGTASR